MISVKNLTKHFYVFQRGKGMKGAFTGLFRRNRKCVKALDGISFDISKGELLGYIGPNGAGKSTTVKILSGILHPDSGDVEVLGKCPWKNRIDHVRNIGVVFGQRTRCDLAAALLHEPDILFLDEPTIGLDAIAKLAIRDFIKQLNSLDKVTVILTTHDMDDIEALCERIIILNDGQIVSDGSISKIHELMKGDRRITVDVSGTDLILPDKNMRIIEKRKHNFVVSFDPREIKTADAVKKIVELNDVRDLYIENPPVEEIIADIYREQG